jgi:hypothetical protein
MSSGLPLPPRITAISAPAARTFVSVGIVKMSSSGSFALAQPFRAIAAAGRIAIAAARRAAGWLVRDEREFTDARVNSNCPRIFRRNR